MTATVSEERGQTGPTVVTRFPKRVWRSVRRRRSARRAPLPPWTVVLCWVLLAISALSLWCVAYAYLFSGLQEHRANAVLYASLRENLSKQTTPIGGVIAAGTPVALIQSEQLGSPNLVVVEGTSSGELQVGPGHKRDTPLPGQPGVSVLFGRSATHGAPFRHIDRLSTGEAITVTTGQGSFTYLVDRVRYNGDPLPPPLADGGSRILLETAVGSGWSGQFAPDRTVFVDATLSGTPQAAPPGRPLSVPKFETAMKSDTSQLVVLVFWLQLLLLISLALVWAKVRWGRWQTWLVGVPLVVAALWSVTSNVMLFIPNLV
jgi:sortase A